MKITFDMDLMVLSNLYRKQVEDLALIAQNLEYADTKYSNTTSAEQNAWRDRCVKKLKAIEAFYLTDEILPKYEVSDWVRDVLNLSHYSGVLTRIATCSCLLRCTPGWVDWDNAFNELSRVLGEAKGKKDWKLAKTMKGDEGMLLTLTSMNRQEKPFNTDLDERRQK